MDRCLCGETLVFVSMTTDERNDLCSTYLHLLIYRVLCTTNVKEMDS